MIIGYIVNQYPKVSHSFIRREIQALEALGVSVFRYSIRRTTDQLVDLEDINELEKTSFVVQKSLSRFFVYLLILLKSILHPFRFLKALGLSVKCGWNSERGLILHFVYFFEACILSSWCKRDHIQHIHSHFGTNSSMVAMLTSILANIPFSFTVHGPEEFDKPIQISLDKKMKASSFTVAISSFGKSQLFRLLPGEEWNKIKIVHCGLDKDFYSGSAVPIMDNNNFVCVGRLCEQKGQLLLIEAANILQSEGYQFHLTLVGDGPMRKDIEKLIDQYKLNNKVTITGWQSSSEVRTQIENSRALVLPSFAEGLPVVIMEAMALARPVITTYIAGIPELVKQNENGWLVPAGDLDSLATTMATTIETPLNILNSMGTNGRNRVLERHNIDTEAQKLLLEFKNSINDENI